MHNTQVRHLFYAEDDLDDLEILCSMLEEIDPLVKVTHAINGKVLLDQLHSFSSTGNSPHLIVLDMNMPIMDGKETLKEIRTNDQCKSTPVVIFSTSILLHTDIGNNDVTLINKPATTEGLRNCIGEMLRLIS